MPSASQLLQENRLKNSHRHQWQLPVMCSSGRWCCFMQGIGSPHLQSCCGVLHWSLPRHGAHPLQLSGDGKPRQAARRGRAGSQAVPAVWQPLWGSAAGRSRFVFQERSSRWHCPLCLRRALPARGTASAEPPPRLSPATAGMLTHWERLVPTLDSCTASRPPFPEAAHGLGSNHSAQRVPRGGCVRDGEQLCRSVHGKPWVATYGEGSFFHSRAGC